MRSRAFRRHQRARIKARHLRDLRALALGPARRDIAIRHPLDCGNPRCGVCHHEKVYGLPRRDEGRRVTA